MYAYLLVNLAACLSVVPFSFDKKVRYVSKWKTALVSSFISGVPFIIWDAIFTESRIWGFNKEYLIGIKIIGLPIEEIMFFFAIPFATFFVYEIVKSYEVAFFKKRLHLVYRALLIFFALVLIVGLGNVYSSIVAGLTIILLIVDKKLGLLPNILNSFLIILIPFVIVNGVLTYGLPFISSDPIVWYNGAQIIGLRFVTIPLEDFLYALSLFSVNVIVYERFNKKFKS